MKLPTAWTLIIIKREKDQGIKLRSYLAHWVSSIVGRWNYQHHELWFLNKNWLLLRKGPGYLIYMLSLLIFSNVSVTSNSYTIPFTSLSMPISESIIAICPIRPSLQSSSNPMHKRAVSCSLLDVARTVQTSLPSTKQPATKTLKQSKTHREILKRIDRLIAVLCSIRETCLPDPLQSPVTPQIIGNTTLTVTVACTSSLVEKDHATDLTLNTVQKKSTT